MWKNRQTPELCVYRPMNWMKTTRKVSCCLCKCDYELNEFITDVTFCANNFITCASGLFTVSWNENNTLLNVREDMVRFFISCEPLSIVDLINRTQDIVCWVCMLIMLFFVGGFCNRLVFRTHVTEDEKTVL